MMGVIRVALELQFTPMSQAIGVGQLFLLHRSKDQPQMAVRLQATDDPTSAPYNWCVSPIYRSAGMIPIRAPCPSCRTFSIR